MIFLRKRYVPFALFRMMIERKTQMMKRALIAATLLAAAGAAQAQTVTYQGAVALQSTNWQFLALTLPQWDPVAFGVTAGDLTSVILTISGNVAGTIDITNQNPAGSALVSYSLQSSITFFAPNGLQVLVIPAAGGNTNLLAGNTFSSGPLSNNAAAAANALAGDFPLYIGVGTIAVGVQAFGTSFASGGGNLLAQITSDAGASYSVTYNWIPTPSAAAVLGLGVLAAGRRRR